MPRIACRFPNGKRPEIPLHIRLPSRAYLVRVCGSWKVGRNLDGLSLIGQSGDGAVKYATIYNKMITSGQLDGASSGVDIGAGGAREKSILIARKRVLPLVAEADWADGMVCVVGAAEKVSDFELRSWSHLSLLAKPQAVPAGRRLRLRE